MHNQKYWCVIRTITSNHSIYAKTVAENWDAKRHLGLFRDYGLDYIFLGNKNFFVFQNRKLKISASV